MTQIKERPMLFSAPMVRAILDGSKTQTRRIVKHKGELPPEWATFAQPMSNLRKDGSWSPGNVFRWSEEQTQGQPLKSLRRWPGNGPDLVYDWYAIPCPYGKPGDHLWVREAWAETRPVGSPLPATMFVYREADNRTDYGGPWKPSIHMPRKASRILLEVVSVRVERLQDIAEVDALAEGIDRERMVEGQDSFDIIADGNMTGRPTPISCYRELWESINGAGSWSANLWVWVIDFKRIKP
jgi:hypothetical protein